MENKEIELKFALSASDYKKLQAHLKPHMTKDIEYYAFYYDTPDFALDKKHCCFRVAAYKKEDILTQIRCTYKSNRHRSRFTATCDEIETHFSATQGKDEFFVDYAQICSADQVGEGPWEAVLSHTGGHALWRIGGVKIRRMTFAYGKQLLELDKVWFDKDTIDYELEVETDMPNPVFAEMSKLLNGLQIEVRPSECGKHGRFMRYREKHGNVVFTW